MGGRAARFGCGGGGGGWGAGEEARKGVVGGAYVRRGIYCSVYHTTQEGKQVKVQKVADLFFSLALYLFFFLFFFLLSRSVFTAVVGSAWPCSYTAEHTSTHVYLQ